MPTINVVSSHLEPPQGYALARGDVRVLWSRIPVDDCAMYAYIGATSYYGPTPQPQVLVQAEPVVTQPGEYTRRVFDQFDYVFPLLESLDGITPEFRRWPVYVYQVGPDPAPIPSLADLRERYPYDGRVAGICMILGAKSSPIPGELYSKRAEMARWFHENSDVPFDVFGRPPFRDLPNYRGPLSATGKRETLAKYQYAVCLENCYDPFWSRGYLTERIPECLETRTIPIYLGCHNIEDHLPDACYVDMRRFSAYADLANFVERSTDADRAATVTAIDAWLADGELNAYSAFRLYDMLTQVLAEETETTRDALTAGATKWTPAAAGSSSAVNLDPTGAMRTPAASGLQHWWTWEHLQDAALDECEAAVDWLSGRADGSPAPAGSPAPRRDATIGRVLYIGVSSTHGDHTQAREYASLNHLAAWTGYAGLDLRFVDCAAQSRLYGAAGMSERLVDYVRRERPDLVFYVPHARPFDILHDAMREISEITRTMAWLTQHRDVFENYARLWPACVDRVVTPSIGDYERFVTEGIGDNVTYAQWGFHPHTYPRQRIHRQNVVTIVGRYDQWREGVRDAFREHDLPVNAYGAGWPEDSFLDFRAMRRTFAESAVNLNIMSRRRVFEVTGSGGFLLTTPTEDLDRAFVTDLHDEAAAEIVVAREIGELLSKATFYLRDRARREAIAMRGYDRAMRDHTWFHRYASVFGSIGWRLPELLGTPGASAIKGIPRL